MITIYIILLPLLFFWFFEKFISVRWSKVYYTFGIPILYRKKSNIRNLSSIKKNNASFDFKNYNEKLLFFRYGLFKQIGGPRFFDFSSLRGYIRVKDKRKESVLWAFINWHIVFLLLLLIYGILASSNLYAKLFLFVISIIIIYTLIDKIKKLNKLLS